MGNITLSVDDQVVKQVRRIALEKDTTLTAMVREYLESVARETQQERERAAQAFLETVNKYAKPMGKRESREDLYDRPSLL